MSWRSNCFTAPVKSVRLTQEGFLFTQYAGEILKLSGLSKARMKESKEEVFRRIAIGCRNTTELHILCPALEQLRCQLQPQALPVLRLLPFDSIENLLTERNVNLMFSFRKSVPKKLKYYPSGSVPGSLRVQPEPPLADKKRCRLRSFNPQDLRPPAYDLFAFQGQWEAGLPGEVLFCDDQEVVSALVETGYAFCSHG